jgi:VWA N-terminal.
MNVAEDAAEAFNRTDVPENYTFYSAKNSFIVGYEEQSEYVDNNTYTPMELHPDNRFYNIPVNLNYSAVHVPTNIYDLGRMSCVLHISLIMR